MYKSALAASAVILIGCSPITPLSAPTYPAPPGITLYYAPPEFGRQNQDVYLVNTGATDASVRVQITIMNSHPQPRIESFTVPGNGRRMIGGTCAGDVTYSTACGSNIAYQIQ